MEEWSGRVDSNHRPQRPERCALNQTALRPEAILLYVWPNFTGKADTVRGQAPNRKRQTPNKSEIRLRSLGMTELCRFFSGRTGKLHLAQTFIPESRISNFDIVLRIGLQFGAWLLMVYTGRKL